MYGNYDERGMRIPQHYGGNAGRPGNYSGGGGNSYAQNIGTTRTEQTMQGHMGGLSGMMHADHNIQGNYGQSLGGQFGGPSNQFGQSTQYSGGQYGQPSYGQINQYGQHGQHGQHSQGGYGQQFSSPTQYQQSDIGTTRSEQSMRSSMGGMSAMMQADRNTQSGYGPSNQYGNQPIQYGQGGFSTNTQHQQQDIGTTRSEQSFSGGMGGIPAMMQADHNTQGSYGQFNQHSQGGYGQQFSSPTQYQQSDIGATRSEQSMRGSMGGMSAMMQADHNTQGYVQSNQYGYQQPTQYSQSGYGSTAQYQPNDIGSTRSEQSMRGGMGGVSAIMQADHNAQGNSGQSYAGSTNQSGPSNYGNTQGSQYGQHNSWQGFPTGGGYGYGSQYSSQNYGSGSQQTGIQNPGDTPLEQAAKQNINPSGFTQS